MPENRPRTIETDVLIIGGGVTGAGLARDLALRGVACVLAEKRDLNAGASGGNHGLLHSGARYAASDREAARECALEGELLKRLAPRCVEDTGGLFVAAPGDDEAYIADFPDMCARSGITARPLSVKEALDMEPALSKDIVAAYRVADAAVDPFMLTLDNVNQAGEFGLILLTNAELSALDIAGGAAVSAELMDAATGQTISVRAKQVVNAAGAWAAKVAALAGIHIDLVYSKGTLIITQARLANMVVNRLRHATDGDILVPGGAVSILGTTSVRVDDPDHCEPTIAEVDAVIREGAAMLPVLEKTRWIRAYAGVRPLFGHAETGGDRDIGRGFALLDHARDGVDNFVTITGGKLTTYRLMAEKTADLVCEKLGVSAPCRTAAEPLPPSAGGQWTEPVRAPRQWLAERDPDDPLLCECEMVSKSVVDALAADIPDVSAGSKLAAMGLRSRIGKGPCQGNFCSLRVGAHLYDTGGLSGSQGLDELRDFLQERWRGVVPILWGFPLMQAELKEALHCAMLGLELETGK